MKKCQRSGIVLEAVVMVNLLDHSLKGKAAHVCIRSKMARNSL